MESIIPKSSELSPNGKQQQQWLQAKSRQPSVSGSLIWMFVLSRGGKLCLISSYSGAMLTCLTFNSLLTILQGSNALFREMKRDSLIVNLCQKLENWQEYTL